MEAQTRLGKRDRTDDSTDPFEESANALANVEGAMGATSNAKPPPSSNSKRTKKRSPTKKERSESIDQLISVAGSLLRDSTATAAAIAESNAVGSAAAAAAISRSEPLVPNPIVLQQESTTLAYANAADSALPPALPPPQAASKPKPKQLPKKKAVDNKKTQVQYNPDVPMTKEQLTSWRREMRRVRNRESAAASRRKVRDRIEELEEEVDVWKRRYEEAMARLARAEEEKGEGKSEEI
jgi:hypothetical protein